MTENPHSQNSHSQNSHSQDKHPNDAPEHQEVHDGGDSQAEESHRETPTSEGATHTNGAADEMNGVRGTEREDEDMQQRDGSLAQEIHDYQHQVQTLTEDRQKLFQENDRLRSHRNEALDRLDLVQRKLLVNFYLKKYPQEKQRLGALSRPSFSTIDQLLDEIIQDLAEKERKNDELVTETSRLEHNLETLQKSLLSNVERFRPTQDDELIGHFENLASSIKVITRDVPSSTDGNKLASQFAHYTLINGVAMTHWNNKLHRKYLLEAAIWSILMDTIFSTPFYVFGKFANLYTAEWGQLFLRKAAIIQSEDDNEFSWPPPSPLCEKWRYVTAEQLQNRMTGEGSADHEGEKSGNQKTDDWVEASHQEARLDIERALMDALLPVAPSIKVTKIEKITRKACELAVQLGLQRCRLQIVAPELEQEYIAKKTTNVMGISGCENIKTGHVAFIVNPGLRKWGDGHGGHLDQSFDLVPALVYIEGN
ncbi:hypothetical protein AOQ84DRAFT_225441 [Glonium stellatum]|uniref:Uncharacterized protein n=1 Tax=Glonium stellatum TaxID=574774 RepID=A0A8E2FDR9_9PEZI|nr:hypothetical protein AOQ84DRAFT_225441 [Glonium stellatum]